MDLEAVALQAVKIKIQEIFDTINVSTVMEGRDIVIRISLPSEIMNSSPIETMQRQPLNMIPDLDTEAQAAANELLGTQPNISQED